MSDMAGIAATQAQADADLKYLREERGISGHQDLGKPALISSLDNALSLFSGELYKTPTHFLLELIQNADDNSYAPGVSPTLYLMLYERDGQTYFRSDCNEVGFSLKQLDALLLVGQSTKSTVGGQKGYIGGKGIGFKSVFKVADVVHIASGFYSFMLDRNRPIGMILPILSCFPGADRKPKHTQFLLEIKEKDTYAEIQKDMERTKSPLLIFLQKLEKLQMSTPDTIKTFSRRLCGSDNLFGGETITIIGKDEVRGLTQETKYVVQRHDVRKLPTEPRRIGITVSEVIVAFPVKDTIYPILRTHKAFAFLPVENCGFQFMIHADFLLVASRESLEVRNSWNLALRDGIRKAFLKAVERFIAMPANERGEGLCYTWPKYLQRKSRSSSFWDNLHEGILNDLRENYILESRDKSNGFQRPGDLFYVPPEFRYNGNTLFDSTQTRRSHLAFNYDGVYDELQHIGVQRLSIRGLYEEFKSWIAEQGLGSIKFQLHAWHQQVSHLFYNEELPLDELRNLPIIPLRDGSWVKAKKKHVYLAAQHNDEHVPTGIDVFIVDEAASQDPIRRHFFEFLGIKEYKPQQVCNLILELHRSPSFFLSDRADDDFVSDAAYLFNHRSLFSISGVPDIWFVVQLSGKRLRSKYPVYFVDHAVKPGLIEKYKDLPENPFPVLVEEYEGVICGGEETIIKIFHDWLLKSHTLRLQAVPTLVRDGALTREWTFLHKNDTVDLLQAVKFHWDKNHRDPTLYKAVRELQMRCLDDTTRNLGILAIPTKELMQECPHLSFAMVPNPTIKNWGFLSEFGVLTKCDVVARLRELQSISSLALDKVDKKAVHTIYMALGKSSALDQRRIQEAFRNHPLVFIAQPGPKWMKHSTCVWTAPRHLKKIIKLESHYTGCKNLFCNYLGVKPADIHHVVDEFCSMVDEDCENSARRFEELSSLLNHFYNKGISLTEEQINKIRASPVFPVLSTEYASQTRSDIDLRSLDDGDWYIPDKTTLESAFRAKANLLNLSVKSIQSIAGLLQQLGCKGMFLSSVVEEIVEPTGESIHDLQLEGDLKYRLKYISCLLTEEDETLKEKIPRIHVWSVPSIQITRRLDNVEVVDDNELLKIQESGDKTDIYIREDISMYQQPMVNYDLANYFSRQFQIDTEDTSLLNLLMSAPINELSGIIEKHDRFIPDELNDADSDSQCAFIREDTMSVGRSENGEDGKDHNQLDNSEDEKSEDEELEDESGPENESASEDESASENELASEDESASRDEENARSVTVSSQYPQSLRELIPSHQDRIEKIISTASNFQMSDSRVSKVSASARSLGPNHVSSLSLPIRTENTHNDFGYKSAAGKQLQPPPMVRRESEESLDIVPAAMSHGGNRHRSISISSYLNTPTSSPHQSLPRSINKFVPVTRIRYREIGFRGELFVHKVMERHINDWTFKNWTSKMRTEAGYPLFIEKEKYFTDFTYLDSSGYMKEVLHAANVDLRAHWSNSTTYHLEIKTALESCNEPFFVSQNQLNMMRDFDDDPNHVYIILRVFGMKSKSPGIMFFPRPWDLYLNRVLDLRSNEGYKVYQEDGVKNTISKHALDTGEEHGT